MAESELDKKVKEAEIRKLDAEAEKANSEKQKIDYELEEAKKTWTKKFIWQLIIVGGGLIGFLTFFITYTIIPISEHNNTLLSTQLAKEADTIYRENKKLDSTKIELKKRTDSLENQQTVDKTLKENSIQLSQSIKEKSRQLDSLNGRKIFTESELIKQNNRLKTTEKKVDSLAPYTNTSFYYYRKVRMVVALYFYDEKHQFFIDEQMKCEVQASDYSYAVKFPVVWHSNSDAIVELANGEFDVIPFSKKYKLKEGNKFHISLPMSGKDTTVKIPVVLK